MLAHTNMVALTWTSLSPQAGSGGASIRAVGSALGEGHRGKGPSPCGSPGVVGLIDDSVEANGVRRDEMVFG
jgi:hypothetical protein